MRWAALFGGFHDAVIADRGLKRGSLSFSGNGDF